jgi:hypothetical protein
MRLGLCSGGKGRAWNYLPHAWRAMPLALCPCPMPNSQPASHPDSHPITWGCGCLVQQGFGCRTKPGKAGQSRGFYENIVRTHPDKRPGHGGSDAPKTALGGSSNINGLAWVDRMPQASVRSHATLYSLPAMHKATRYYNPRTLRRPAAPYPCI